MPILHQKSNGWTQVEVTTSYENTNVTNMDQMYLVRFFKHVPSLHLEKNENDIENKHYSVEIVLFTFIIM